MAISASVQTGTGQRSGERGASSRSAGRSSRRSGFVGGSEGEVGRQQGRLGSDARVCAKTLGTAEKTLVGQQSGLNLGALSAQSDSANADSHKIYSCFRVRGARFRVGDWTFRVRPQANGDLRIFVRRRWARSGFEFTFSEFLEALQSGDFAAVSASAGNVPDDRALGQFCFEFLDNE